MNYKKSKEKAKNLAVEYQILASGQNLSYGEILNRTQYFTKLAKKYGLTKEFKENGII